MIGWNMKIIIENRTDCDDEQALNFVMAVIRGGLVSGEGTATGLQYCYCTAFIDETNVYVHKYKSGTQKFILWKKSSNVKHEPKRD